MISGATKRLRANLCAHAVVCLPARIRLCMCEDGFSRKMERRECELSYCAHSQAQSVRLTSHIPTILVALCHLRC